MFFTKNPENIDLIKLSRDIVPQDNVGRYIQMILENNPNFGDKGVITEAFNAYYRYPGIVGDCAIYYSVKKDNGEIFTTKAWENYYFKFIDKP